MLPCGMFPSDRAGNVFSHGFGPLWAQVKEETAAIRLPAQCALCESKSVCRACAAMTVTETGRFDGVPEYRCRMAKAYPSQRQRLVCQLMARCDTLKFGEE